MLLSDDNVLLFSTYLLHPLGMHLFSMYLFIIPFIIISHFYIQPFVGCECLNAARKLPIQYDNILAPGTMKRVIASLYGFSSHGTIKL